MRRSILLALALLGVVLLAGTVSAGKEKGTDEVLEWGDFIGIRIDTMERSTEVEYDVTVTEGARVSVYYVPEEGWEEYNDVESMTFKYVPTWSVQDTRSARKSFTETDGGAWYVIIENADLDAPGVNSTVSYEVTWKETSLGDYMVGLGLCLVVIVVVIIAALYARKVRKQAEPSTPPMDQPSAQQAHDQQYQRSPSQRSMDPSDMGPGYVPPEPGRPPQQPEPDPHRPQGPPQF
jgi:hypothetical protein